MNLERDRFFFNVMSTALSPPRDVPAGPAACPDLPHQLKRVRRFTETLAERLLPEDTVIQSMPDVSPTKWHLAHTTWFFETFLLLPHLTGYKSLVPEYGYLFNSYYNAAGPMHCRDRRGLISRPGLAETLRYRAHVDQELDRLCASMSHSQWEQLSPILTLGIHHEQQHQELLLTDIKHVLAQNPLLPVFRTGGLERCNDPGPVRWRPFPGGLATIGADNEGFCFDNELPAHREFLAPFSLASRLVTNGEFAAFIEEGGYEKPEFWLSLGWQTVRAQEWTAPLYWMRQDQGWRLFTLAGPVELDPNEPVCHLSYFEADAFARWAGARLPTEAEWECAARGAPVQGEFVESGRFHPASFRPQESDFQDLFGSVWEWTRSSYAPYPGYKPPRGALGEYNGKFMCNQYVLRGGSCATSETHIRRTYRNFFQPEKRWQFMGLRLARDGV